MQRLLLMALLAAGVCAAAPVLSGRGPLAPGGFVHLKTSRVPPVLTAEEQLERTRRTAAANRPGPAVTKGVPAVMSPADVQVTAAEPRAADNTFRVIQDDDLRTLVPPADTSSIGEPCAVRAGSDVLVVGNWYAARSTDGHTYEWMDPAVQFPGVNGGFCCDQNVVYDPARGLFIWELVYSPDPTSNTVRIAYASTPEMEANQWHWVDVTPGSLGFASRLWLDYPQLGLSRGFLHLTANVFEIGRDVFNSSVAVRIPLDDLAAGAVPAAHIEHFSDPAHFTLTPVQGADDVMYFGSQEVGTFGLHIYAWPDASASSSSFTVPVRAYGPTSMVCKGPDGRDWCGRSDDRVMTGWRAGGLLGFMWNAAQDTLHTFPYVRVARIEESTTATKPLDEPDLVGIDTAYQYPAVSVSAAGHVGGVVAIGGGARYPGTAAIIADDLTTGGGVFEVHDIVDGDNGPTTGDWGDFLCSRPDEPDGTTWVTTAYALRGGGGGTNVHPHVVRIGRERDITCSTDAECPDDGESCTSAVCTNGHCSSPPLADGTGCPAPDACALTAACAAGVCTATSVRTCVDDDPCTADTCDPILGCVFPERQGYDGVLCAFDGGIAPPECGTAVPARVSARFARAQQLVDQARLAGSSRAQRRELAAAARALARALEGTRSGHLERTCRRALGETIGAVRRRVRALRTTLHPGLT